MNTHWNRIEQWFHQALELGAPEREAFLARIADDDPVVAAEVRSLLASHDASSGFLGTPAVPPPASTASPGDTLGPYRIVEEIGRGGMASSIAGHVTTRASPRTSRSR